MSRDPVNVQAVPAPMPAPAVTQHRRAELYQIMLCLASRIYYDDESFVNDGRGEDEPEKYGSGYRLHQLFKMSKTERMMLDRIILRGEVLIAPHFPRELRICVPTRWDKSV